MIKYTKIILQWGSKCKK